MLDKRVLEILVALTKRDEAPLRLNGAWGLMVRANNSLVTISSCCFYFIGKIFSDRGDIFLPLVTRIIKSTENPRRKLRVSVYLSNYLSIISGKHDFELFIHIMLSLIYVFLITN